MARNDFLEKFSKKQQINSSNNYQVYLDIKNKLFKKQQALLESVILSIGAVILIRKHGFSFSEDNHQITQLLLSPCDQYETYALLYSTYIQHANSISLPSEDLYIRESQIAFNRFITGVIMPSIYGAYYELMDIDQDDELSIKSEKIDRYLMHIRCDGLHICLELNEIGWDSLSCVIYVIGCGFIKSLEIIPQDQLLKLCVCLDEIINSSLDDDSKNKFGHALGDVFNDILLIINEKLDMDLEISLEQLLSLNKDELRSLFELWEEVVEEFDNSFSLDNETFEYEFVVDFENNDIEEEDIPEPQADSKASSAILKFFDSNSNTLIAKLKESGLQLSAAALQNDQNIARVANVVYNLLPGMVRIFVSYDTVENFLLNNRQWLINKLV
ncbi:hypothetical protein QMO40_10675 [Mannheimia bovis]|uniref:hypothetical protein n=1 Tax=Mannheimia bovis TaxID=2770636 RepID=UPI0024B740B4|nr:hypothetical protein [Mannheimia bovis]WHP47067.1 hypothetical protein QMO40_10675 [Mannheimia bovis]